jgi:hypothetical protein
MPSTFPPTPDSFSTKVDGPGNPIMAAHVNSLQDAVIAAQEYALGLQGEIDAIAAQVGENLLSDTLTHESSWLAGLTLPDVADDTYGPSLWNVLSSANAPDIAAFSNVGANYTYAFGCTLDATGQAGIVQFMTAQATRPLRGGVVSLSADIRGSAGLTHLRMAVISWTGTADAVTSDVVGSWGTGNPTLATSWAYIGTPVDIAVTTSLARHSVENLTVPTGANNIAVLIWTPDSQANADFWGVTRVKLEQGAAATEFVARDPGDELARIGNFLQKVDASNQNINIGLGTKTSASRVISSVKLDEPMRAAPSLSHNISAYTAGAPGTTTVALVNLTGGGFYTITGALTTSMGAANKSFATLQMDAGTSWSGTIGDLSALRIGPDVVMLLDSRL